MGNLFHLFTNLFHILYMMTTTKLMNFSETWNIDRNLTLYNPLDHLLLESARVGFGYDVLLLACITFYVVAATLHGIRRVGIRFLWLKLFNLKANQSPPQAILLMTVSLMFVLMSYTNVVLSLAPQYSTFGLGTYTVGNSTVAPCTVEAMMKVDGVCPMSHISTFYRTLNDTMVGTKFD